MKTNNEDDENADDRTLVFMEMKRKQLKNAA